MSHRHLLCKDQKNSTNTNITAATQSTHTDTSSADTNITAATQITHTDTSSAATNITAATLLNLTRFRDHSRRTRDCGEPYGGHANGCGRLRTVANGCERLRSQTQLLANTASPPDPQVKREPSLRIREKTPFQYSKLKCKRHTGKQWVAESLFNIDLLSYAIFMSCLLG